LKQCHSHNEYIIVNIQQYSNIHQKSQIHAFHTDKSSLKWEVGGMVHKLVRIFTVILTTKFHLESHKLTTLLRLSLHRWQRIEPALLHSVQKKGATLLSTITLAFLGRFLIWFLYHWKQEWILHDHIYLLNIVIIIIIANVLETSGRLSFYFSTFLFCCRGSTAFCFTIHLFVRNVWSNSHSYNFLN